MTAGEGVRVTVAASPEEIDGVRASWDALQRDAPATDPRFFLEFSAAEPGAIRPHVVLLERDGVPEAALVAKIRRMSLPRRLGPVTLYSPTLRALVVVDGGVLGLVEPGTAATLVDALLAVLERGEADVCVIRHVPLPSPLRDAILQHVPRHRRSIERRAEVRWSRPIPDDYDELLATLSKNARKGLRSSISRLEREFGDRLALRAFRSPSELDGYFHDAEEISRETYQRDLGVGFRDDDAARRLATFTAERGWFRGWVLYLDERPVAFDLGVVYRQTFHWISGGFDPAFAEHRPGAYLTARILKEICADPAVSALDFGLGDADYKRRLACSRQLERDVVFFAARARPLWINLVRNTLTLATEPIRAFRKTKIGGRIVTRIEHRRRRLRAS